MAKNLATAVAKHIASGADTVSNEEYEQRLAACNRCPNLVESERCGLCGCYVERKAKWATSTCPDSPQRWKKHIVGSNGKKLNLKK